MESVSNMCVCVHACVCVCTHVCVWCACVVRVCVPVCVCTLACYLLCFIVVSLSLGFLVFTFRCVIYILPACIYLGHACLVLTGSGEAVVGCPRIRVMDGSKPPCS